MTTVKKLAIFVEGQTEQLFISQLLTEIAGQKNISITMYKLTGGGKSSGLPRNAVQINQQNPQPSRYEALIYDCGTDNRVKSDILDNLATLKARGYDKVIGLRDLYPQSQSDLTKVEQGLKFVPSHYQPIAMSFDIVLAVMEVEAWFLAECSHFLAIAPRLTESFILASMGFDPCNDDMSLRVHPAQDLDQIYRLIGKSYTKKQTNTQRTVACLDYTTLYLSPKLAKLQELIQHLDGFLV